MVNQGAANNPDCSTVFCFVLFSVKMLLNVNVHYVLRNLPPFSLSINRLASSLAHLAMIIFFHDDNYNLVRFKSLKVFFFLTKGKTRSLACYWLGFTYALSLSPGL